MEKEREREREIGYRGLAYSKKIMEKAKETRHKLTGNSLPQLV